MTSVFSAEGRNTSVVQQIPLVSAKTYLRFPGNLEFGTKPERLRHISRRLQHKSEEEESWLTLLSARVL